MKTALIGDKQTINTLTAKIKNHDYFKLLGSYVTDSRTLKVNQASIISPFGLINHSDCVFFHKNQDTTFNLILEAVKSSKHILILNPQALTQKETGELIKLSGEAVIDIYVVSEYLLHPVIYQNITLIQHPLLTEVYFEQPEPLSEKNTIQITDKMIPLIDAVLSLSKAAIRKIITHATSPGNFQIINLLLEFDNGTSAVFRFSTATKTENCLIRIVKEKIICELNPAQYTTETYSFKKNIQHRHSAFRPSDINNLLLKEFENAIHSEHSLLTKLTDFQKTQHVIRSMLEKINSV